MDVDRLVKLLEGLAFRDAVWFFPLAFTLHVLEEWPHFPGWAQRYASERFTRHEYVVIHLIGVGVAVLSAATIRLFPHPLVLFAFFGFVFTPATFFNALFHTGATAASGVHCPGLITALTVYIPLYLWTSRLAYREGLLTGPVGVAAFVVAGVFHLVEVGHNVYKAW